MEIRSTYFWKNKWNNDVFKTTSALDDKNIYDLFDELVNKYLTEIKSETDKEENIKKRK